MFSNINCEIIINNRVYLLKYIFKLKIKKMIISLLIKRINNKIIRINKYATISIYVRNTLNDLIRTIYFIIKIHIMNDLKINIFIDINIITSKEMLMNLNAKILILIKYQKLQTLIDVIIKSNLYFKRIIRFKFIIFITSNIIVKISIIYNNKNFNNKDFLFKSNCAQNLRLIDKIFIHIVNITILII